MLKEMTGFLFNEIVFGPVKSRRLGVSLGINLLPTHYKYCTYNCIYCECGWNQKPSVEDIRLPGRREVYDALEARLADLKVAGPVPDAITFAGNGEPTIHPEFDSIIEDTRQLRDKWFPDSAIGVLSNASMLHRPKVLEALQNVDMNILKLDAGTDAMFRLINQPPAHLSLDKLLDQFKLLDGNLIIQSIFFRGKYNGQSIDNTTPVELNAWVDNLLAVKPQYVMVYTIDRETPARELEKVSFDELLAIGRRAEEAGIPAKVYG